MRTVVDVRAYLQCPVEYDGDVDHACASLLGRRQQREAVPSEDRHLVTLQGRDATGLAECLDRPVELSLPAVHQVQCRHSC
jgi:hypothetical protein